MKKSVLIITINYNGAVATEKFLASLSRVENFSVANVILVDNASQDDSAARLREVVQSFNNVKLLESEQNRGYFGGANWALQSLPPSEPKPDWTIICNNDILFEDTQFLTRLLAKDSTTCHVLAPSILVMPTEVDCNPFMFNRPSGSQLARFQLWQSNYYLMWFKQWLSPYVRYWRYKFYSQRAVPNRMPTPIYAPHGSFMIFSRSYFDRGGYIDDGFFLYAEEFSVAEICRRLKLSVVYDPELRVWHDAHGVTGRLCTRRSFQWGREGLDYAIRTYFSDVSDKDSVSPPVSTT